MNINNSLNPYNSNLVNNTDVTKMSQGQSLTGTPADSLKAGEIFEGSVNSIENGKVTIGLANGQTMTARLDSGVSLAPGQSIFFEVKSNDGSLIQIRPVSLGSLDANPTLLKALNMANIAANERTINMVNSMMQNSMPINPENLAAMNRAMINNPTVDMQTLVTMAKHGMEITQDNVNMFVNYANDKAVLVDNFEVISDMLPELMTSSEVSVSQAIELNNQIREIFMASEGEVAAVEGQVNPESQASAEATANNANITEAPNVIVSETAGEVANPQIANVVNVSDAGDIPVLDNQVLNGQIINEEESTVINQSVNNADTQPSAASQTNTQIQQENIEASVTANELGNQTVSSFAGEQQITSFNTLLNSIPDFPKDNLEIFREDGTFNADANIKEVFREITDFLNNHPDIPKETLNDIIKSPLYRGLLKSIISDSFAMEPKDVTKPGEVSKLYERVLKQTNALEKLMEGFSNKAAEAIKVQTNEIRQNVNFMNSANEMYNFVQIPLKMYNQNTDGMLYVRQNKKSSYEDGEEITAFLHFDMEYLGPTDVFIKLKESNVGCKWNLANEESMNLIEQNLDLLTERLAAKGFTVSSQVTCNEPRASFVEDFLGEVPVASETSSDGLVHRYSFDMRA